MSNEIKPILIEEKWNIEDYINNKNVLQLNFSKKEYYIESELNNIKYFIQFEPYNGVDLIIKIEKYVDFSCINKNYSDCHIHKYRSINNLLKYNIILNTLYEKLNQYSQLFYEIKNHAFDDKISISIEIKPTLGDEYPCVLRQIKNKNYLILIEKLNVNIYYILENLIVKLLHLNN